MEYLVNQALKLPVTSTALGTGLTTLPVTFLVNGAVTVVTPTFTEIGSGLYTVNFTPAVTGKWTVFVGGKTYEFEIVSKTLQNALGELLDESLGSWSWNKASGLLTLFKGDGTTLATYTVIDTPQAASRERIS
jgi:hypothetical protein